MVEAVVEASFALVEEEAEALPAEDSAEPDQTTTAAPLGPGDLTLRPVERPEVEETSEDLFDLDTNALGPEPAEEPTEEEGAEAAEGDVVVEEVEAQPPSGRPLAEPSGLMLREDATQDGEPAAVAVVELDEDQPTAAHSVPAIAVAEAEAEAEEEAATEPETAPVEAAPAAVSPAPAPAPTNDPIYMLMLETVGRMSTCYDDQDMPPPVATLRSMVESQDYDGIRTGFSTLWSELVSYHRDRGMQLQPRVSHTFRTIDTIVRNL